MKPKTRRWIILLILLLVAPTTYIKLKGRAAWDNAQERARTLGISLNLEDYQLPDVPPEENFIYHPDFSDEWHGRVKPPLEGWLKMDISQLDGSKIIRISPARGLHMDARLFFKETLSENEARNKLQRVMAPHRKRIHQLTEIILSYPLRDLSQSHLTAPLSYDSKIHLRRLKHLTDAFVYHAHLDLQSSRPASALRTLLALEKFSLSFSKGFFICRDFYRSNCAKGNQIIWEGLRTRSWSKSHLREIDQLLTNRDFLSSFDTNYQHSLAETLALLESTQDPDSQYSQYHAGNTPMRKELRRQLLAININQRKANLTNSFLDLIDPSRPWSIARTPEIEALATSVESNVHYYWHHQRPTFRRAFEYEISTRITRIAIALELYFLEHNQYTKRLTDLPGKLPLLDVSDPKKRNIEYTLSPTSNRPELTAPGTPDRHWRYSPVAKP